MAFTDNIELKKQGFIYEATEATSESMADLPNNRTMLLADLTDKPATSPEMVYDLETIEAVFEHFKPKVKVEFQDEEGASKNEEIRFENVGDFGKDSIIKKSEFLGGLEDKHKDHKVFARRLQNNKVLQKVLSDPRLKEAYLYALRELLKELEGNE